MDRDRDRLFNRAPPSQRRPLPQQQPQQPANGGMHQPYSPPPPQQQPQRAPQQRPPPPAAAAPRPQQQSGPIGPEMSMRVVKSPSDDLTYSNLVAVSPHQFRQRDDGLDTYVSITNLDNETRFVFSARPWWLQGGQEFPPDSVGLSLDQRAILGVDPGSPVSVQPVEFNVAAHELAKLDLTVAFASNKTTKEQYDQGYLSMNIVNKYAHQVLAPQQKIVMKVPMLDHMPQRNGYDEIKLRFTVRDMALKNQTNTRIPNYGILTPDTDITFYRDNESPINLKAAKGKAVTQSILKPGFRFTDLGIGGLEGEFSDILRRAFATRIFPKDQIRKTGINHVRGLLLHGPPGTGKTLIARQIGQMLDAKPPKIINGPEVLNKFVGQSEENVRKIFADAEKEQAERGDESGLHIIIFDELDAVCKQRGSGSTGGTGVGDSVVNQLLTKLDGVEQLNNILLIGMTNRKDMIDEALLRPGRLEVHVEIPLPNEEGRHQIFEIHTAKMRKNDFLAPDVNLRKLAAKAKNYSGAEITGVVNAATSLALSRHIDVGDTVNVNKDYEQLKIQMADFEEALAEVKPAYGVSEEAIESCIDGDIYSYGPKVTATLERGKDLVNQVSESPHSRLVSVLFWGPPGSGKTALAAKIALESGFPFIRRISAVDMKGFNDSAKIQHINKVFSDAHKSEKSIILLDSIETIIDWSEIGPRFTNNVLVSMGVAMSEVPPNNRRLLVLATTSNLDALQRLQFVRLFQQKIHVQAINTLAELKQLLILEKSLPSGERDIALALLERYIGPERINNLGVAVKKALFLIEFAKKKAEIEPDVSFGRAFGDAILNEALKSNQDDEEDEPIRPATPVE